MSLFLPFTICLIRRKNQVLLINKEKKFWMGRWNGVGGKIEQGESPKASILREIEEETTIRLADVRSRGIVTWSTEQTQLGGMYVYDVILPDDFVLETPFKNGEGILDWKDYEWILHPENKGIADTLPYYLPWLWKDRTSYNHYFVFEEGEIKGYKPTKLDLEQ
ncbi:NUDIX hydrolase [Shimazuella kribbensis]|uniref:NUDIX hydrolase n=1 Tax=Shimazuella kribbensis TaxID=139808 RepID=UPI000400CE84|nr:8-oxo-dGTP diphosphatase [Shimazuella kribbensis]